LAGCSNTFSKGTCAFTNGISSISESISNSSNAVFKSTLFFLVLLFLFFFLLSLNKGIRDVIESDSYLSSLGGLNFLLDLFFSSSYFFSVFFLSFLKILVSVLNTSISLSDFFF
jgi:hypothetical protein